MRTFLMFKRTTWCKHGHMHISWAEKRGRVRIYNPERYGCNYCIRHGGM
jgi:hypothetical protein